MSVTAALPNDVWPKLGTVLTIIVPSVRGCDLACPFCYIEQRGEVESKFTLNSEHYSRFIQEVARNNRLRTVCIQGYEPLLPDSFLYTRAILSTGQWLNIPTSLVTNGTHLAQWADELAVLAPGRISVSLDAA